MPVNKVTIPSSAILTIAIISGVLSDANYFTAYLLWLLSIFFVAGLTIGNLNALGMEPLGHMAGLGASIIGSASTVAAVAIALDMAQEGDLVLSALKQLSFLHSLFYPSFILNMFLAAARRIFKNYMNKTNNINKNSC